MDFWSDTVSLSRMQFALTASIHMLWPTLTTGVGIYLVVVEGLWLKTRNPDYYYHARFWAKLYALNFGVGVATGIPMEFQFGTNWAPFSEAVGNFFGSVIGFEASWAFMLEAAFFRDYAVRLGAGQCRRSLPVDDSGGGGGQPVDPVDFDRQFLDAIPGRGRNGRWKVYRP
jgi:cytochrome bd-type quinol oxidase subunit 1